LPGSPLLVDQRRARWIGAQRRLPRGRARPHATGSCRPSGWPSRQLPSASAAPLSPLRQGTAGGLPPRPAHTNALRWHARTARLAALAPLPVQSGCSNRARRTCPRQPQADARCSGCQVRSTGSCAIQGGLYLLHIMGELRAVCKRVRHIYPVALAACRALTNTGRAPSKGGSRGTHGGRLGSGGSACGT
jgi:hypothetical protein